MQEDQENNLQQYHTLADKHIQVQNILDLDCSYPSIVYNSSQFLKATIKITPHVDIPNLPLQIEIRGHSNIYELNTITADLSSLQITESFVFDEEDKPRNALLESTTNPSVFVQKNQQHHIEPQMPGEYFLEGCQVLFQVDSNKDRVEILNTQKSYEYPVQFMLPVNLPVTLASKVLKTIYISIRYSLNLKFVYPQNSKQQSLCLSLPFDLISKPKSYPQEQLILSQQIRLYHQNGKQQDEQGQDTCRKVLKLVCADNFYKKMYPSQYSQVYNLYDLHYIELNVVVSKDNNLFLMVRTYREPDKTQLTFNRDKKVSKNHSELKEQTQAQPPEVSFSSIKQINKKTNQFSIHKIDVKMYGQLKGISKELIFSKSIYLTRQNYDMTEGETVVSLKQFLDYPYSSHNELFDLHYYFTIKTHFQDQQLKANTFETYLVSQQSSQLQL